MNTQKIRKITNSDIDNITQSIKDKGLYQLYYSIKDKKDLTRQDRLLLGYLNSNYLRNNDLLDEVTIPMIQRVLRGIIKEEPKQIQRGVIELEKQKQEKLRFEEERKHKELLESRIFKTICVKGIYPYSDGEGFSTTMNILLQLGLDKDSRLLTFNIIDLQPQQSFYEIYDYMVEHKKLCNRFYSMKGKSVEETLKGITIISKESI